MPQFGFVSCFLINGGYTFLTRVNRISIVFSLYHIFVFTMCRISCFSWTLCDPIDCGPPGFSVCGILQARILKWVAMPSSRESFWSRDRTQVLLFFPALAGKLFTASTTWEAHRSPYHYSIVPSKSLTNWPTYKPLPRDFPGGPTTKAPSSQCRSPGFDPWSGS